MLGSEHPPISMNVSTRDTTLDNTSISGLSRKEEKHTLAPAAVAVVISSQTVVRQGLTNLPFDESC